MVKKLNLKHLGFVYSRMQGMLFDNLGMTGFDGVRREGGCTPSFSMGGLVKEAYATVDADETSYAMAA